jgi:hypothetical protein
VSGYSTSMSGIGKASKSAPKLQNYAGSHGALRCGHGRRQAIPMYRSSDRRAAEVIVFARHRRKQPGDLLASKPMAGMIPTTPMSLRAQRLIGCGVLRGWKTFGASHRKRQAAAPASI